MARNKLFVSYLEFVLTEIDDLFISRFAFKIATTNNKEAKEMFILLKGPIVFQDSKLFFLGRFQSTETLPRSGLYHTIFKVTLIVLNLDFV